MPTFSGVVAIDVLCPRNTKQQKEVALYEKRQGARTLSMTLLPACCIGLICCHALAAEQVALTKQGEICIKRFMHPLPHEIRLKGTAYRIPAAKCAIQTGTKVGSHERQTVNDFKARWQKRFGTQLGARGEGLLIVAGLVKTTRALRKAAEGGLFDAKYLSERPNAEQAYVIATEFSDKRATVYLAANDTSGLYYALLTFDQLLRSSSTNDRVVFPHVKIVDWPDIRMRGSWTVLTHVGNNEESLPKYDDQLRRYSQWKYNLVEAWKLRVKEVKGDGTFSTEWPFPKKVIEIGKRYSVEVFPGTGHIPHMWRWAPIKKHYPKVPGTPPRSQTKIRCLCMSHPQTREMIEKFVVAIAREYDVAQVGLSELEGPRGVCQCPKCKGNLQKGFLTEIQIVMQGYDKAKKINPDFRLTIGLTQGSYPHHFEMLKYVPKDIVLDFYNGKMTYKTYFQKYNLPPSVQELQRLGYTVGSCPSPTASHYYGGLAMYPFQTPQYCRLLCGEAVDRHLDFVLLHLPTNPLMHDLNAQACAEFLWNSRGRTAGEFTVSWAVRKGLDKPEETAAIIDMLEYPARGLSNCFGNASIVRGIVAPIVKAVTGKDSARRNVYGAFEYRTHEEMARIRAICEEATTRAKRLDSPEFSAGCELLEHWITILERYAYCVEHPRDEAGKRSAFRTIKAEAKALRKSRDTWIEFKPLGERWRRTADKEFDAVMKAWESM